MSGTNCESRGDRVSDILSLALPSILVVPTCRPKQSYYMPRAKIAIADPKELTDPSKLASCGLSK